MKIAANGLELEVEVSGQGSPLLLVMGIGSQLYVWPEVMVDGWVQRGFQVIRFDHRDIGRSTWLDHLGVPDLRQGLLKRGLGRSVEAPYTLSDMAEDSVQLIEALGLESAHVCGVSMGGMVAQHMAIEHPQRVLSLTSIMSTTGARRHALASRPGALRALMAGPTPKTLDQAEERLIELTRAIGTPGAQDHEEIRRVARLCFPHTHPAGFLRHFAAILASGDRTEALHQVRCPTLVLHGSLDPLIVPAAGRATAKAIPNADFELLEGMAHDLPTSHQEYVVERVARHCSD